VYTLKDSRLFIFCFEIFFSLFFLREQEAGGAGAAALRQENTVTDPRLVLLTSKDPAAIVQVTCFAGTEVLALLVLKCLLLVRQYLLLVRKYFKGPSSDCPGYFLCWY
jgi:hypothetical protein